MRSLLVALVVVFVGCSSSPGPQGPEGAQGPAGAVGPKGDKGDRGDVGAAGSQGADGATGPAGPQGVQGPPGQVLVLDGGVVTGHPGSSVLVTPIVAGAECATGGIRVTQLSDAGVTTVCNGAAGPVGGVGPQGPMGPQGVAGPQGSVGPAPGVTTLAMMSPQCATGGVLVLLGDGGTLPICNGATGGVGPQGPVGAAGPTGATGGVGPVGPAGGVGATGPAGPAGPSGGVGPAGPVGPQGPAGPAGSVLYLDGGVVVVAGDIATFAGFTSMTFTGNLGGNIGANAKCSAQFPGAALCTRADYDLANTTAAAPIGGAWIDQSRSSDGTRGTTSCNYTLSETWTYEGPFSSSSGQTGAVITPMGRHTTEYCNVARPLACCHVPSKLVFRGYTTATFTGNLGGYPGAHAKCAAEFPGAALCTRSDFDLANPTTPAPTGGAWLDPSRSSDGTRVTTSCNYTTSEAWTFEGPFASSSGQTGALVLPSGRHTTGNCNVVRPIACCSRR